MKTRKLNKELQFYKPSKRAAKGKIILINAKINAGFPSPAEDFEELRISLDKELISDKDATFFARASGSSMIDVGISDGDLLVIDRSIEPYSGAIAVCFLDGDFTVKRIKKEKDTIFLEPANESYKTIEVDPDSTLTIWGIVTYVIKKMGKMY